MALIPGDLELLHPGWLWLLPALAGLALAWRRLGPPAGDDLLASAPLPVRHPLLARLGLPHGTAGRRRGTGFLIWPALACLILALGQPVRIGKRLPDPPHERDIVFLVDTGVGMLLRDYLLADQRVSRMALLKALLDRFVRDLQGERIAVIVFGESAYTFVPLTRDTALVRRQLARLRTTLAGRFNAVGEAIALAVRQAEAAPHRHRLLVLFSDVSRPTGRIAPEAAADLAAAAGLPLYTVAIGATTHAAEEHRRSGLIYHPVNRTLLAELAARTGARSYLVRNAEALHKAIADIDRRETNPVVRPPRHHREALYPWPLFAGLVLLGLLPLFPSRKGPRA